MFRFFLLSLFLHGSTFHLLKRDKRSKASFQRNRTTIAFTKSKNSSAPTLQKKGKRGAKTSSLKNESGDFVEFRPAPQYPLEAKKNRLQGTVIVSFATDHQGFIKKIVIEKSSGHTILDEAATRAILNWRVNPHPETFQSIPIIFKLREKEEKALQEFF